MIWAYREKEWLVKQNIQCESEWVEKKEDWESCGWMGLRRNGKETKPMYRHSGSKDSFPRQKDTSEIVLIQTRFS